MMDAREPRLTLSSLGVLRAFLEHPRSELAGADLQKITGLRSGTLYPILLRFEEAGWLTSAWESVDPRVVQRPRRRYYKLTALGRERAQAAFAHVGFAPKEAAWTF